MSTRHARMQVVEPLISGAKSCEITLNLESCNPNCSLTIQSQLAQDQVANYSDVISKLHMNKFNLEDSKSKGLAAKWQNS